MGIGAVKKAAVIAVSVGAAIAAEPVKSGIEAWTPGSGIASLRRLFRLSWKGEALALDRSSWKWEEKGGNPQELQQSFADLFPEGGVVVGPGGPGVATSRSDGKEAGFDGRLRIRTQGDKIPLHPVDVLLRDRLSGNAFELHDDGLGSLRIVFTDGSGKVAIFYNQARNGRFNLGWAAEGQAGALSGSALATLCKQRQDLGDGLLFPLLGRIGVDPPLSPRHRTVVAVRHPLPESEIQSLIRRLDHPDPAKREEATRILSDHSCPWQERLRKIAVDPEAPRETRDRLNQVLDESFPVAEVDRFIAALEAVKDPAPSELEAGSLPLLPQGLFPRVSDRVGRMLSFDFKEDLLRVDRDQWNEPFRGKSEEEVLEMLRQDTPGYNLAEGMMPRSDDPASDGPALLKKSFHAKMGLMLAEGKVAYHFNRLREVLPRGGAFGGGPLDKYFYAKGLSGTLVQNGSGKGSVHLALCEESDPHRCLDFLEDGAGRLRVYTASPGLVGDAFFFQASDGRFALFAFRGGQPRALAGEKFKPFYEKNREWLDPEFFGALNHLGVLTPGSQNAKEGKTR